MKKKENSIPHLKSLEEEKAYWETLGPLAEGQKGRVSLAKQRRSSFLVIRLTGEELTRLRNVARERGLGPSTYGRLVLKQAIENDSQFQNINTDEFINKLVVRISQEMNQRKFGREPVVRENSEHGYKTNRPTR